MVEFGAIKARAMIAFAHVHAHTIVNRLSLTLILRVVVCDQRAARQCPTVTTLANGGPMSGTQKQSLCSIQ